jgi:succinyl-diaminopimelate desuccinylase
LAYEIEWSEDSLPYESDRDCELVHAAIASIREVTQGATTPRLCTSGGTSDGRFVAAAYPYAQIVELGLINKTIHKVDENVASQDLETLTTIYANLLDRLLCHHHHSRNLTDDEEADLEAHVCHETAVVGL